MDFKIQLLNDRNLKVEISWPSFASFDARAGLLDSVRLVFTNSLKPVI